MSLKSFKKIRNFRTKKHKMISQNVISNFDFDDVIIDANTFKYISTFISDDVTKFKWNCITLSRIILINQTTGFGMKTPFPGGLQCIAIQRNNSIDQDVFLNAGEYSLSYYLQKRPGYSVNQIQISISGTVIFTEAAIPKIWTLDTNKFSNLNSSIINVKFAGL